MENENITREAVEWIANILTAHRMKGRCQGKVMKVSSYSKRMESSLIVLPVNYEMGMKKYLSIEHITKSNTISKLRDEIKALFILRKKE
jgi:hypoxanthine-guanine phosphoribosyltransferase